MMVYGDPCYKPTLGQLLSHLRDRLSALHQPATSPLHSLDGLRRLLCETGQLEQAMEDANPQLSADANHPKQQFQTLTDQAAEAFYARCFDHLSDVQPALSTMARNLDHLDTNISIPLRVKTPEGFAFYALYPEQYCAAAHDWLANHRHANPKSAIVVGIRSIGTTLSAAVAAALKAHGWNVRRLTVRPTGHPYARRVAIAPDQLHGAAYALVADEGPGLSGSSMAAVAQALVHAGLDQSRISFLPGHTGPPGHAASAEVRSWWTTTRRYVRPLDTLQWLGQSLPEILATHTTHLCTPNDPLDRTEDLTGGLWRRIVYTDPAHWPAVSATFERMKYRCVLRTGQAILWKFAGFVGEPGQSDIDTLAAELRSRARRGWTPTCLDAVHGFLAMPWIPGTPLSKADTNAIVLEHMGRYIADVAGPPLSASEQAEALARLREMLITNTREALGEPAATRAQQWCDAAAHLHNTIPSPTYGDGRLAPHEWLRTPSGQLVKVDPVGHTADHTLIGRQSLLWDVAGASVEWGLDDTTAAPLLRALPGSPSIPRPILIFYRLAYAAFRLGTCDLSMHMCCDNPAEQTRLRHARDAYRLDLASTLEKPL